MTLTPGKKLGPYEILSPLGAGGMGEVYRARDTRLGRDVAVKVLADHLSSNPEVRARFEREARTISSFNHPHICVLHDVGREAETDFLVMELVEGESLASRLERGGLPTTDLLKLGAQIADALDRAHRAGIVHRDLKPGNVMLTRTGAKLMDFGLSRASAPSGSDGRGQTAAMSLHTPGSRPITAEGSIVGTFQYMAPEQLEGKDPDPRSDIWALGCVLYEMATGKRAFEGKSQASLIGAIMNAQPVPITKWAPLSPPGLDRLIRQCLTSDPDERWQSAGDVRRELEWIATSLSGSALPAVAAGRRSSWRARSGWITAVVIALTAIGYMLGPWSRHAAQAPLMRFSILPPPGLKLNAPAETEISPDGTMLVFVAFDSSNTYRLYIRALASPNVRVLPGTENAALPFWAPDGSAIAFFSDGKLRRLALDGGVPTALCDAPDPRGGDWSRDGVILFAPNNQGSIARVSANGGSPVQVTQLDATRRELGHRYPQFLPDGRHFLYVAIGSGDLVTTWAQDLEGGAPVEVCQAGSGARWVEGGYLLYLDTGVNSPRRRLLARGFDLDRQRATGDAELLLDPVNANNFGYANITADKRGTLVVQHWSRERTQLTLRDRTGQTLGVTAQGLQTNGNPEFSPDDQRLAYGGAEPRDLLILDLASGISTRLTFENQTINSPVWSHDGSRIAFARLSQSHGWQVYVKATDGTGLDSLLFSLPGLFSYPLDWSRDGRWLIARGADTTGNFDLWKVPMDGSGKPELYQRTPAQEAGASLSPDGQWLAYVVEEEGKAALYVQSFPVPAAKYQVAIPELAGGGWSPRDGELLVVTTDRTISAVQVQTAGGFRQGAAQKLFRLGASEWLVDVTADGQRFLVGTVQDQYAISELEVVLGWTQLLEQRR